MSGFESTMGMLFGVTWLAMFQMLLSMRKQKRRIDALYQVMRLTRMAMEGFKCD